jgi:hypothetical protein
MPAGTQFPCFPSTKLQILRPVRMLEVVREENTYIAYNCVLIRILYIAYARRTLCRV